MSFGNSNNESMSKLYTTLQKALEEYENETDNYLNKEKCIKYMLTQLESCDKGLKNKCLVCGLDMGYCNPRQLCGKGVCNNESI